MNARIGENESVIGDGGDNTYDRKVLQPELLSDNVVMLTCESGADGGICHVYLVGTCHVSKDSSKEVEAIVRFLQPQVVFLELCSSRVDVLYRKNTEVEQLTLKQVVNMLRDKRSLLEIFVSWYYAKVARKLGVVPGAEFRAAYLEAKKYGGDVILGDRDIQITCRRIRANMAPWGLARFIYDGFFRRFYLPKDLTKKLKPINYADIPNLLKGMDSVDLLALVEAMSKRFPYIAGPLIHERDRYMSAKLVEVARKHQLVVAVVGKAHLQGIQRNWEQPVDLEQLLEVPSRKSAFTLHRIFGSTRVVVVGAVIISGIYLIIKKK